MSYINVKFINREYSIPKDLLTYLDLLDFTTDIRITLNKRFYEILRNEEIGCISDEQIRPEIDKQVGRFIGRLLENGIYDRTITDYLNNNKGFEFVCEVNKAAFQKAKELLIEKLDDFQAGVEDALYKRDSSITGMGFSIWSGSFINHAIYAAMEASALNKQEAAANKEYQRDLDMLRSSVSSKHDGARKKYIDEVYIPNMEAAIAILAFELLDSYISDLIRNGKLDSEILKYINIDRSNDLLKNLELSPNKEDILYKAFETCPYNFQVYEKAMVYGFINYDTYKTAQLFKQGTNVLISLIGNLGEVEFPKDFKINYDVAEKVAELTKNDVVSVLQAKTKEYVVSIIESYGNVIDMLNKKDIANKVICEFDETTILEGDLISKEKANQYVNEIVAENVWHELVYDCGYTDLLERIKEQVPGVEKAQTKKEVDAILASRLYDFFECARLEEVSTINEYKEQERKRQEEAERIKREKQIKKASQKEKAKQTARKGARFMVVGITIVVTLFFVHRIWIEIKWGIIVPAQEYEEAVQLMEDGDYQEAYDIFSWRDDYKDSAELAQKCIDYMNEGDYNQAVALMNEGKFESAILVFEAIIDYKDSKERIDECEQKINERKEDETEKKYNNAILLANEGAYKDAISILNDLGDYKNSVDLIEKYSFLGCEKGDEITFGYYEQDNNLDNGTEKIEWLVLERNGNQVFVISKYCLDTIPFNETLAAVTWENCTLRKWLNDSFLNTAFSAEEQSKIISSKISNPDNVDEDRRGNDTVDKIFLLSENEALEYFMSDSDRKADGTEYVSAGYCYWLLRTTGSDSNVAHVDYEGVVGYYENVDRCWWVRPAMWVEISD